MRREACSGEQAKAEEEAGMAQAVRMEKSMSREKKCDHTEPHRKLTGKNDGEPADEGRIEIDTP